MKRLRDRMREGLELCGLPPLTVSKYLYCANAFARREDTHHIGISNRRLVAIEGTHVTFRTNARKTVTIPGELFLRRFLKHVLPHTIRENST